MHSPLFTAFLAALALHVVGLPALLFGWQAWQGSSVPPSRPELIAITPVLVPAVPSEPEPVIPPESLIDSAPDPMPVTPATSVPLALPPPPDTPPPPQAAPRSRPRTPQPIARAAPPQPVPVRPRQVRTVPPAGTTRGARPDASPGVPDEPLGSAGSGAPSPSPMPAPAAAAPQSSAPDVGPLAAHGAVPVASGTGLPGQGGVGAGGVGEGNGAGGARSGAGSGSGGGIGPGRGGAGGSGGSGGTSVRPLGGYQVKPRYPESARRQGVEGIARLKMRITEQGRVEDVQIEHSAGHPDLDLAALEAVRRWRFEPARRGGDPVAVWVVLPVEFKLQ